MVSLSIDSARKQPGAGSPRFLGTIEYVRAITTKNNQARKKKKEERMKVYFSVLLTLLVASLTTWTNVAIAHNPEFSYIWLQVNEDGMKGRVEADTRHVNIATGLGISADDGLTAEQEEALINYMASHLSIGDVDGPYWLTFVNVEFMEEAAQFVVMHFELDSPLPAPDELTITYSAIMHAIPEHRGGFHFEYNYRTGVEDNHTQLSSIHAPGRETAQLSTKNNNRMRQLVNFVSEGIEHIWIGIDHILFLVTLLLTSVLVRKNRDWQPTEGLKEAVWNVVAVVTVFTVAHSITLALAMKGWVTLPSRFVESVIALSILVVVIDNFYSFLGRYKWSAVFIFGLFHGLGFASVLEDMTVDFQARVLALIGFNVGVEIGQLAIVLALFPVLYLLRRHSYLNVVLRPASAVIGVVACWWLVQRTLDLPSGWTSF